MVSVVSGGVLHDLPSDLRVALRSDKSVLAAWESLTPLARNEFICFVTSPKRLETRVKRVVRAVEDLGNGKRRPCCWPGCPHHNVNAKKYFK